MLIFDPDKYLQNIEEQQKVELLTPVRKNFPVPLQKLPPERRFVSLTLDYPLTPNLRFRDTFDWDLNNEHLRPLHFAQTICTALQIDASHATKLANSILD